MKSLQSTLILLLIVAAVGGYIYFNERGTVAQSDNTVLLRVEPSQVASIHLTHADSTDITLEKNKGQWQIRQPKETVLPADPEAIKNLLDHVQLIQAPATLPTTPDKLREYGLDTPRSTLKLNDAVISFGNRPPFDTTRVYARVESDRSTLVGLVPSTLSDAASKPLTAWRDKSVLRLNIEDATHLQIQTPVMEATFKRHNAVGEANTWKITQPIEAKTSSETVHSFLSQLAQTQAIKFLEDAPESPARWGLDKPQAMVKVVSGNVTHSLRIGKRTDNGYAAQGSNSSAVMEIPTALFTLINRPLREWRDKALLRFEIDKITQLEIKARGQNLSFQNNGGKWVLKAGSTPADAQAQHQAALDVLLAAQGLTAQEFIDRPQALHNYGLEKAALQLTLRSSQWSGAKTVSLATANGKIYGQSIGSGPGTTVYVLMPSTLEAFKTALDVLMPKLTAVAEPTD